jgi:hypothetical protein
VLARLKLFRFTIAAQLVLLAVGWVYRWELMAWWLKPLSQRAAANSPAAAIYWESRPALLLQLDFVVFISWLVLAPIAASEAWIAAMRWARRPAAIRHHLGFALASWAAVLGSAAIARLTAVDAFAFVVGYMNV